MNTPLNSPRAIYFDLGNVLLTFDHRKACRQMAAAAGRSTDDVHACLFGGVALQSAYERGQLSSRQFCDRFREHLEVDVEDTHLLHAASDMFEVNSEMIPVAVQLKAKGYNLGILSNTCEAHWDFISDGRYSLVGHFEGPRILSYEVQSMKPDQAIYEAAIDAVDCAPSEIFFTDDRAENVEAAVKAGIDAVLFTSATQLSLELLYRGIQLPR